MLKVILAVTCLIASALPSFAQKAEIESVNAQYLDFFNKGDFARLASLYTRMQLHCHQGRAW